MTPSRPPRSAAPDARDAAGIGASSHQRRKAERPMELLEAALALFTEKGFAATRAEEVAVRAGVSKGTLYLYYSSKEELLKAVIRTFLGNEISAIGETVARSDGSAIDALLTILPDWWLKLLDSPASGVFKLVVAEMRNFPELAEFYRQEVVEPGERIIGQTLQRGIDRGELRPLNVPMALHSIMLPLVMLCIHKHSLGACGLQTLTLNPRQFIVEHIQLMLEGMKAPGTDTSKASS